MYAKVAVGSAIVLASLAIEPLAMAGSIMWNTTVSRVRVVGDQRWGGCMALLGDSFSIGGCPNRQWVSFDCAGIDPNTDPVRAYRMLDQAQLALVSARQVEVEITNEVDFNGVCLARRIDVK
jgi:hypothetical protein